ncbi:DUF4245 domain-containing protein [Saxibacter everestensis]|uniref:DUF4245 domain-containing protein n=1 Tax=Saxibacter everestensis TaxID=2909229 RepID=A0ABY8QP09_9MICO|nr:DUF4245 domain-containing protein [Brevibacteriaceae bacterium ZFBP1038]
MNSANSAGGPAGRNPRTLTHREQRNNATMFQVAIAVIACLLVAVAALALAPHPEKTFSRTVDVAAVADGAREAAPFTLATPDMPGWNPNEASFSQSGNPELPTWYISYVDDQERWLTVTQVEKPDKQWINAFTGEATDTGTRQVAGLDWQLRDDGSTRYMIGTDGDVTYILKGKADDAAFGAFAEAVVESVK